MFDLIAKILILQELAYEWAESSGGYDMSFCPANIVVYVVCVVIFQTSTGKTHVTKSP